MHSTSAERRQNPQEGKASGVEVLKMVDMKSKSKYKFTDEFVTYRGHTLRRIIAISDFGDVKAGDIGGFIETVYNLSHEGNARVYDDALVYDARVYGNARVCGDVN